MLVRRGTGLDSLVLRLTREDFESKALAGNTAQSLTVAIVTNTFSNLNKYILQFGQIHFAIRTNNFAIWANSFVRLSTEDFQFCCRHHRVPCYSFLFTYMIRTSIMPVETLTF